MAEGALSFLLVRVLRRLDDANLENLEPDGDEIDDDRDKTRTIQIFFSSFVNVSLCLLVLYMCRRASDENFHTSEPESNTADEHLAARREFISEMLGMTKRVVCKRAANESKNDPDRVFLGDGVADDEDACRIRTVATSSLLFEDGCPPISPVQQSAQSLDIGKMEEDKNKSEQSSSCPICLEEYCDGDEVCGSLNIECGHVYHRLCITEWILIGEHAECPLCRSDFLTPNNLLNVLDDGDSDSDNDNDDGHEKKDFSAVAPTSMDTQDDDLVSSRDEILDL